MKKVTTFIVCLGFLLITAYISVNLYTNNKLNYVKQNVLKNNIEITKVEKINSIGKWGEWFSEYVLIVEMDKLKYRMYLIS
nr:hypothetical protein [Lysinibacillus timonensis]